MDYAERWVQSLPEHVHVMIWGRAVVAAGIGTGPSAEPGLVVKHETEDRNL